ncbi:hypothetical protein F5051DRAFT_443573 [Lentinula edodes]|nr:hypothetical protein F5051DRAFT_443573 [Lentinula edodes]
MATTSFQGMPPEILSRIAFYTVDCATTVVALPLVCKQAYIASIPNLYAKVTERALPTLAKPSSECQELMGCRHPAYYVEHVRIAPDISNDTFLTYFVDAFNNVSRYAKNKKSFTFQPFYLSDLRPVPRMANFESNGFEAVSLRCSTPPNLPVDLFSSLMTALCSRTLRNLTLDFHMVCVPVIFPVAANALNNVQLRCPSLRTLHIVFDALRQGPMTAMNALFHSTSFVFPHLEDFHLFDIDGDLDIAAFLLRHPKIKKLGYVPGWTVDLSSFLKDPRLVPLLECFSGCGHVVPVVASYPFRPLTTVIITDWKPETSKLGHLIDGLLQIPSLRDLRFLQIDCFTIDELRMFESVFHTLELFECNLIANSSTPDKTIINSFYDFSTHISPSLSRLIVHTFYPKSYSLQNIHRDAIDRAWSGRTLTTALHISVVSDRDKQSLLECHLSSVVPTVRSPSV